MSFSDSVLEVPQMLQMIFTVLEKFKVAELLCKSIWAVQDRKFSGRLQRPEDPNWCLQPRKIQPLYYIIRPWTYDTPISLLPPWSDSSQLVPKYKRNTSNNIRRHARVFLKGVPQSSWDVSKIRSWSLIVDLLRNMCLSKSCKIRNKTATLESFFNKVTDTQLY